MRTIIILLAVALKVTSGHPPGSYDSDPNSIVPLNLELNRLPLYEPVDLQMNYDQDGNSYERSIESVNAKSVRTSLQSGDDHYQEGNVEPERQYSFGSSIESVNGNLYKGNMESHVGGFNQNPVRQQLKDLQASGRNNLENGNSFQVENCGTSCFAFLLVHHGQNSESSVPQPLYSSPNGANQAVPLPQYGSPVNPAPPAMPLPQYSSPVNPAPPGNPLPQYSSPQNLAPSAMPLPQYSSPKYPAPPGNPLPQYRPPKNPSPPGVPLPQCSSPENPAPAAVPLPQYSTSQNHAPPAGPISHYSFPSSRDIQLPSPNSPQHGSEEASSLHSQRLGEDVSEVASLERKYLTTQNQIYPQNLPAQNVSPLLIEYGPVDGDHFRVTSVNFESNVAYGGELRLNVVNHEDFSGSDSHSGFSRIYSNGQIESSYKYMSNHQFSSFQSVIPLL